MGLIRVDPGALASGGGSLVEVGGRLDAVRGELAGLAGSASALGEPLAAGAYLECAASWERALTVIEAELVGLGGNAESAAGAYVCVDTRAMQGGRP